MKAELYAEAQVPTYRVVDMRAGTIEVHSNPKNGRYASVERHGGRRDALPVPGTRKSLRVSSILPR